MFKKYSGIPEPLQKEALYQFGYGFIAIIVFAALILWTRDLYSIIPGVIMVLIFWFNAYRSLRKAAIGDYVIVSGVCSEVVLTTVRKRPKSFFLKTDEYLVQVMLKQRHKKIYIGALIDLYVDKKATVEDKDGVQRLHSYLVLDQKGQR